MASFKNMEMAPIVASHPHIFVKHGFFDLFTRVYYRPTLAEVDCIRNYYTVLSGNAIHQFLLKFQNAPTCAEHIQLKLDFDPNGNYCMELCVARDGSFCAVQLFRYAELEYVPITEVKTYEGHEAELLSGVLYPRQKK